VVSGGAVVVPQGLVDRLGGGAAPGDRAADAEARRRVERCAVEAVLAAERRLGREPREMAANNPGYDIESRDPVVGELLFIEAKGRVAGSETVSITRNEVLTGLNKRDRFVLALVLVNDSVAAEPRYLRDPFQREPDFGVTCLTYDLRELLARAGPPL
jgi:hypothetical protein